ncbi:MAG: hypothetical protein U5N86_01880 [Planctomycetota bacterium]|nr:hypothetical protein [Planctomycetota bacterium]
MAARKTFGNIAIEKGYITEDALDRALVLQARLRNRGRHEKIGILLLRLGEISSEQLLDVLVAIRTQKNGSTNDSK